MKTIAKSSILLLVITCAPLIQAAADNKTINNTQSQLDHVAKNIDDLVSDISSSELKREKILQEIQQADQHIAEQSSKLDTISSRLKQQQQHIQDLKSQLQTQREILSSEQITLAQQLRSAHVIGHQEKMKMLLNQQNASTLNRTMIYHDYLSRARSQHIGKVKNLVNTLQKTERTIHQEETDLLLLKVNAENERSLLETTRNKREKLIAFLNGKIQDKDAQVKELKKDHKALKNLLTKLINASKLAAKKAAKKALKEKQELEHLAKAAKKKKDKKAQKRLAKEKRRRLQLAELELSKNSAFRARKGKFFWPTTGYLASRFGSSKASGLASDGVMISTDPGKKVQAIHPGRVVFAEWLRGFGLLIIIDHGKGYMSLYGHNQKLLKKVGNLVEMGTAIATTGSSGGKVESALYFGIRLNGKPLNPQKWCVKARGNKIE